VDRAARLTWADCETIVAAEVKRIGGRLRGYDPEDLHQEAAAAASRAYQRIDDSLRGTGAAFVRSSVRHALTNLKLAANAAKRCPQSRTGRPLPWYAEVSIEGVEWDLPTTADPERTIIERQLVAKLRSKLPQDDFDRLVAVFVDGAEIASGSKRQQRLRAIELNLIRVHAAQVLDRLVSGIEGNVEGELGMQKIRGYRPPKELSECHADGKEPQGYDPAEPECVGCPDKVVCLPRAIEAGLITLTLEADREVQAVLGGALDYSAMYQRLRERAALSASDKEVPPELLATNGALVAGLREPEPHFLDDEDVDFEPEPEPEEDTDAAPDDEPPTTTESEPGMKKAAKKKTPTKKALPKKAAKKAAPAKKPAKVAKAAPAKKSKPKPNGHQVQAGSGWPLDTPMLAHTNEEGWPLLISGKPYPKNMKLTEQEMRDRLASLRIGQPDDFVFEYGMKLVRKRRNAEDIEITIRPHGFEFSGVLFGSHSSCLMWALGRICSGNEHLNIAKSSAAVVTDKRGKVLLCKGML